MFLNCHSRFSFHYGTLSVEQLLEEARNKGVRKLALTDINNTSAVLDFIRLAPEYGVEPVVGIEFRNGDQLRFIGIARNNEGFSELNRYLSDCLLAGSRDGKSSGNRDAIITEKIPRFHNVAVIVPVFISAPLPSTPLRTSRDRDIIPPVVERSRNPMEVNDSSIPFISEGFSNRPSASFVPSLRPLWFKEELNSKDIYYGISPQDLTRLPFSPYKDLLHRCVILWPITVRNKTDFNIHRLLCAIGHNTLLSKVPESVNCHPDEIMVTEADVRTRYSAFPQIIRNTEQLLEECSIAFDFHEPKNKRSFSGSRHIDKELLERETWAGAVYRYGSTVSSVVRERIEKELRMIGELGFAAYFLVNWDIVRYARRRGYFYVGRGSGANSIVAYCLRITDVDPIDLDLYFERFINPYRRNPPDFDLDFSWRDRDELTAYIFRRFGTEHTALLATYSTYQRNAVIRELGKVFGLPPAEIDALQDVRDGDSPGEGLHRLIRQYSVLLQDFPHHLGIHAGGILISERPITDYTALNHPPKGFPVTQFSMLEAEDIGLYKYDILSQRGLGHIRDTVDLVKKNQGLTIDIHRVEDFKRDERVRELVRNGRCMGCFYVESPAMRMLLKKLRVDTYLQLVAASSIIRPGVARSGMMREYILRTHDPSRRTYIHPVMKELMEETFGIMVYQEDVIKVAHHFAGLDLSEADVLRRGMSGKFRSREEFRKIQDRFFESCAARGHDAATATEVWRQIESFAGYSFSKAHSASYAVESYQSLYLKAHYPLEFMVAVINNFGGFYRTEFYVHEARMQGACIHAPDINLSEYLTDIHGRDIYLGFIHLQNLRQDTAIAIVKERQRNGLFSSLEEFMRRVSVEQEQLRILVRIGAFRFTGRSKKQLLWDLHLHLEPGERRTETHPVLFAEPEPQWKLPELTHSAQDDVQDEMELLGFALSSPFERIDSRCLNAARMADSLRPVRLGTAADFQKHIKKNIMILGYLVTTKPTRTVKGERMAFGTWLDQDGFFFDTTHFPRILQLHPFRGSGIYRIEGRIDEEFGFCSVTVERMEKLALAGLPGSAPELNPGTAAGSGPLSPEINPFGTSATPQNT